MEKTRGRPKKAAEDLYLFKTMRFPPDLWEELEALVPPRQRSAVVHEALRREIRRLRRQQAAEESTTA